MRRCGECGSSDISIKNIKGQHFLFKEYRKVPLLEDYSVRVCNNCGNSILSNKNIWELNELLEKSIRILVEKSIAEIVECNDLKQMDVAKMLGQTPQYISNMKSGTKLPSFATLSLLKIYSKYPSIMEEFTGFKARCHVTPVFIETTKLENDTSLKWHIDRSNSRTKVNKDVDHAKGFNYLINIVQKENAPDIKYAHVFGVGQKARCL